MFFTAVTRFRQNNLAPLLDNPIPTSFAICTWRPICFQPKASKHRLLIQYSVGLLIMKERAWLKKSISMPLSDSGIKILSNPPPLS